jgi:transcription elongation factor GreA
MSTQFLTESGYQKLQEELEILRTEKREEIAKRLHDAQEEGGDLIENAEYEAAKNEQAFVEGRIKELEILLATARIIPDTHTTAVDTAQIGAVVTIQEEGNDPEVYTIVGAAEANPTGGRISNESPIGKALLNHKAGDMVQVDAPAGSFTVKILKLE